MSIRFAKWWCLIFFVCLFSNNIQANGSHDQEETMVKGSHGGRLFKQGALSLELVIYEKGMSPHFRAWIYHDGVPVKPEKLNLLIQLKRFGNAKETITFQSIDNFLQSEQVIAEPHSFDVSIKLNEQGTQYVWNYSSYEGRVKILPAMLKAAHIQTAVAKSEIIREQLNVVGKIMPNRDTMAPIYPRYSGIIKAMNKNLGDAVSRGDVLVIIESNESLQNYNIVAPVNGTVVQKRATTGELAKGDRAIYEIADLNNVWADLTLYRKEAPLVKQGMTVIVTGDEGKPQSTTSINYISPLGIEDSQTILARAILPNQDRTWLPGMYVNAAITIKEKAVEVAVPLASIQRLQDMDVVFIQQGDMFEATPVELGEQDDHFVEIRSGLKPGQRYVSENSFFLKAELGKNGASHEH